MRLADSVAASIHSGVIPSSHGHLCHCICSRKLPDSRMCSMLLHSFAWYYHCILTVQVARDAANITNPEAFTDTR